MPEILKATEIIIVEGEKDADNITTLGLTATTNPFGAGSWLDHFGQYLKGKDVVLLPDNDDQGREHMQKVAANLKGHATSIKWLDLPDLPGKGDVSDFMASFPSKEEAAERLAVMIESAAEYEGKVDVTKADTDPIRFVDVADWLESEPVAVDQILKDTFDRGDKVAVIGALKMKKTFLVDQLTIALASGRPFLKWENPRPRRVCIIQFEVQPHHKHRRIKRLCKAMGVTKSDLGDRLQILNARGLGITGPEGLEKITPAILAIGPDIIIIDPLYKLSSGVENSAEDAKVILNAFDKLAEQTGAAVLYVHHDAKGSPGDRDIRDRGAGSNVIGRDYDACFVLTSHATEPDAIVIDVLLRNYKPQESFVIQWEGDDDGYQFIECHEILPKKKTSSTKAKQPALPTYLSIAEAILGNDEMEIAPFKATFKTKTELGDNKIRDFISWATAGGNPYLTTREQKGYKMNKKWIRVTRKSNNDE